MHTLLHHLSYLPCVRLGLESLSLARLPARPRHLPSAAHMVANAAEFPVLGSPADARGLRFHFRSTFPDGTLATPNKAVLKRQRTPLPSYFLLDVARLESQTFAVYAR